jgi:hypothetical protein
MVAAAIGIGTAVAGVASSAMSSSAAGSAAQAQENAANTASADQMAMFRATQANEQPYMNVGNTAVNQLGQLASGNYSSFYNSPNYQFAQQQGLQALDASAAAKGNLYAGGYGKDLEQYGQGLASQQYNNYYGQLMGLASLGQNAASTTGYQGANAASQSGNDLMTGASAYGTGQINQANAWSNGLGQVMNGVGTYLGYQSTTPSALPQATSGLEGVSDFEQNYGNSLGTLSTAGSY